MLLDETLTLLIIFIFIIVPVQMKFVKMYKVLHYLSQSWFEFDVLGITVFKKYYWVLNYILYCFYHSRKKLLIEPWYLVNVLCCFYYRWEKVLTPLESACEDIKRKTDDLLKQLNKNPKVDLKQLQINLQGAVMTSVNQVRIMTSSTVYCYVIIFK